MKEIGIYICNYNKAEFVVECVQKIINQTYRNTDIFIVDNASTDDSVKLLNDSYGNRVTILQNEENLGGSGGFGRAIRTALEMDYKYFMLVDNDAFLEEHVVEYLYEYMETHQDVGICGAETLNLQQPDRIQDLGGRLDLENYQWGGIIGGLKELEGNVILECDYVASCSVMARTEAVKKFGGFPEENFIYWDDIEWCTKCWKAGYKVVVNGYAKVWHDMSGAAITNMFLRYYANRNRYKFFTKYLPEDRLEDFYKKITTEFFSQNYGAMRKGKYGTAFTAWNALDDFMHGITGKAAEGKIVPYTEGINRLTEKVKGAESVLIYMPSRHREDYDCLNNIMRYLMKCRTDLHIKVTFGLEDSPLVDYDMILQLCKHVTEISENILPRIYIDRWRNCILDEDDFWYFRNYQSALKNFQNMYKPLFDKQCELLRKDWGLQR